MMNESELKLIYSAFQGWLQRYKDLDNACLGSNKIVAMKATLADDANIMLKLYCLYKNNEH